MLIAYVESHSLNMHAQLASGLRDLIVGLSLSVPHGSGLLVSKALARQTRPAGLPKPLMLDNAISTKLSC